MKDESREWLTAVAGGAVVLTVNRRLARQLAGQYDHWQREMGRRVWPTPEILPWGAWLERCFDELLDQAGVWRGPPPLLLGEEQEVMLWEGVVAAWMEEGPHPLLNPALAASLARQAWILTREWGVEPTAAEVAGDEDGEAWREWAGSFARRCREGGWICGAELSRVVGRRLGGLELPSRVMLAGFDRLTPAQSDLVAALEGRGVAVVRWRESSQPGEAVRVACADPDGELRAAARWARQRVRGDPECRVGIIVPGLAGILPRARRIFREVLEPEGWLAGEGESRGVVNFSLGAPLGEQPLVVDALGLLMLGLGEVPVARLSTLLRSPHWSGGRQELGARADLDARLRNLGWRQVGLGKLQSLAGNGRGGASCPALVRALEGLDGLTGDSRAGGVRPVAPVRQMASPARWARRFSQWLHQLGWPGEGPLGSEGFQVVEAWHRLLAALAGLERVVERLEGEEARQRLHAMARRTPFQPRGGEGAPVEVMGSLEATGERFDQLWIAGLHDERWPELPQPNPFLPTAWQRRHAFPRSSAEGELEFARWVTGRLLAAAPRVVVSHPLAEGDRPLKPSPLVLQLPLAGEEGLTGPGEPEGEGGDYRERLRLGGELEEVVDPGGPALESGAEVTGGSRLFQDQAQCPFRAFARHRLAAEALEPPRTGLDPRERGKLVHRALERFWQRVQGSLGLAALEPQALARLVGEVAGEVVEEGARHDPESFTTVFKRLERQRLARLLVAWAAVEGRREHPFQVMGREVGEVVELEGMGVQLRLDRVDRLEGGGEAILDYKTGPVSVAKWFGARPEEPQLPLYCLGHPERVTALAVATLKPGELGFAGVAREEGVLPGVKRWDQLPQGRSFATWEGLVDHWGGALAALAREFRQGEAAVLPQPGACLWCDLAILCRTDGRQRGAVGSGDEEEVAGD